MLVRVFGVLVVLVPVTVPLTRAMMVTLRALVELALQHLARHTGRMLEHQLAAIHAGCGEDTGPTKPQGQGQRPLPLPIRVSRKSRQSASTAKIPAVVSASRSWVSMSRCTASPWAMWFSA